MMQYEKDFLEYLESGKDEYLIKCKDDLSNSLKELTEHNLDIKKIKDLLIEVNLPYKILRRFYKQKFREQLKNLEDKIKTIETPLKIMMEEYETFMKKKGLSEKFNNQ